MNVTCIFSYVRAEDKWLLQIGKGVEGEGHRGWAWKKVDWKESMHDVWVYETTC